jgi:hypothetical protein
MPVQPKPFFSELDKVHYQSLVPILMRKFILSAVGTYMLGNWAISRYYSPEMAIGMNEVIAGAFRRWLCRCDTSSAVGAKEERDCKKQ